ncbi:MAG: riboflavin synthase [Alphaproteobacteria bacterium]
MFTGIVTDVGQVRALSERGGGRRLEIATSWRTEEIAIGASIACSGACLTVVERAGTVFAADASAETLACTTLGAWRVGDPVNLERALKAGDELGGHIMLGHVDGVGTLVEATPVDDSHRLVFDAPADLARFIASKGSIAIDGVSLTVNDVDGRRFAVNIIPHTWSHTAFHRTAPGTGVNLEIDVLARYAARLLERIPA